METLFTPWQSLLGGVLIGSAAVVFLWSCGKVMGISGMLANLLPPWSGSPDSKLGLAFIGGVLVLPVLGVATGQLHAAEAITDNYALLGFAGLCVGYGTAYGKGCTSGHGVCGLARLSPRSMVATGVFMGTGALSVYFGRHIMEWF